MEISWGLIQTAVVFLGPMLLPRLIAFYRSLRNPGPNTTGPIPLPSRTAFVLNLLLVSAIIAILSTLPYFSPPNIFTLTSSRLQTPTNVLFTRLATHGALSPASRRLRKLFDHAGLEARLLYLRFGPDVLATCPLVSDPADPSAQLTYFLYALPALLAPHVAHLTCLGLATSDALAGRAGARFRLLAVLAGTGIAAVEIAAVGMYDHQVNAKADRATDVEYFFWKRRVVRGVVIAGLDALLGWAVWLGATKRAFVAPPTSAEKIEESTKKAEALLAKLRGLGTVRNVVMRNRGMRAGVERYWTQEEQLMGSVMEDRGVVSAMADVLGSMDVGELQREAGNYVDVMLPATGTSTM